MSGPVEASKADAITAWNARAEATTGADALVGQKIDRALVVAMEDFINEPRRGGPYPEPMDTRDYRAEAYRVWTPLCRAILSAIDEGRG